MLGNVVALLLMACEMNNHFFPGLLAGRPGRQDTAITRNMHHLCLTSLSIDGPARPLSFLPSPQQEEEVWDDRAILKVSFLRSGVGEGEGGAGRGAEGSEDFQIFGRSLRPLLLSPNSGDRRGLRHSNPDSRFEKNDLLM